MKFEFFPNEILLECFQYLNTFEIFYSFNQLNNRIDTLIRNIRLSINFDNVNKLMFDQFCKTNPDVNDKIYSLKISNKDQLIQAKIFFSYFPLNKSSLQNFQLAQTMESFDLLSTRRVMASSPFDPDINLPDLLSFKLQTLTVPYLYESTYDNHPNSSILNLTIGSFRTSDFPKRFKKFSQLKYLRINDVDGIFHFEGTTNEYSVHLQTLVIDEFNDGFENFELFVKQIPNLKSLTISNSYCDDMIDANRWEQLITSSLPHLTKFKFIFRSSSSRRHQRYTIIDKFKEFQSDFWQNKHWYTGYVTQNRRSLFHTIPYPFNKYQFELNQSNCSNNKNTFVNVTDLTVYPPVFPNDSQDYFPNVISMTLIDSRYSSNITKRCVEYLNELVNLSNIKHLRIASVKFDSPSILLELLQLTPKLSSMMIFSQSLELCFQNDELCQYLNKMIKRLETGLWKNIQLNKFCEIFSNLEYLICTIDHEDNLLFLIEHLPKLSILKADFKCEDNLDMKLLRFKSEAERLNFFFNIEKKFIEADTDEEDSKDYYTVKFFIWITNKI